MSRKTGETYVPCSCSSLSQQRLGQLTGLIVLFAILNVRLERGDEQRNR